MRATRNLTALVSLHKSGNQMTKDQTKLKDMTGKEAWRYGTKLYLVGIGTAILVGGIVLGFIDEFNPISIGFNVFIGGQAIALEIIAK